MDPKVAAVQAIMRILAACVTSNRASIPDHLDQAQEHLEALRGWFERGGFQPSVTAVLADVRKYDIGA